MKKEAELKYFDKEWTDMKKNLKAFLETNDQEHIHKFRVQVKKLRALLILLSHTSKQAALLESFKPVRKIFKKAGIIREAFINLQVAKKYNMDDEAFITEEQEKIITGTTDFKTKGKFYLKKVKKSYKKILHQLMPVPDKDIEAYYNKQLHEIAVNMIVSGFSQDMHNNRKLIKILLYNYKLTCNTLNNSLSININYMDKLQEAIGNWHDNLVTAELLASHELEHKKVITNINRKNAGVKRNITQMADDFLTKATSKSNKVLN